MDQDIRNLKIILIIIGTVSAIGVAILVLVMFGGDLHLPYMDSAEENISSYAEQAAAVAETIPAEYTSDAIAARERAEQEALEASIAASREAKRVSDWESTMRVVYHTDRTFFIIGDSRTVGMYMAVTGRGANVDGSVYDVVDGDAWAGKNSMGLAWMKADGSRFIDAGVGAGCSVVILLGVNDIGANTDTASYVKYINEKASQWNAKGAETFFVSVNPVDVKVNGITNDMIEDFNTAVREGTAQNVYYIDTYHELAGEFGFTDRLHYQDDTYKKIYDKVIYNVTTRFEDNNAPVCTDPDHAIEPGTEIPDDFEAADQIEN